MERCASCKEEATPLFEVFVRDFSEWTSSEQVGAKHVCSNCLVGWHVPVHRSSKECWEFGYVQDYNETTGQHHVRFGNNDNEYAFVDVRPFKSYVEYHDRNTLVSASSFDSLERVSQLDASLEDTLHEHPEAESLGTLPSNPRALRSRTLPLRSDVSSPDSIFRDPSTQQLASYNRHDRQGADAEPYRHATSVTDSPLTEHESGVNRHSPYPWFHDVSDTPTASPKRSRRYSSDRYDVRQKRHRSEPGKPWEDATLFRLYMAYGPEWSKIDGALNKAPGAAERRFRELGKDLVPFRDASGRPATADRDDEIAMTKEDVADASLRYIRRVDVLKHSVHSSFGPFQQGRPGDVCKRCGLMVPSRQTGRTICRRTGWCRTCVVVPAFCYGNTLRDLHGRRK